LVVVLLTAISAAPSHAGCGWVLWWKVGPTWGIEDAFDNRAECLSGRERYLNEQMKTWPRKDETVKRDERSISKEGSSIIYYCLPSDTSPKG
jgi:hypothetical protein